MCLFQKQRWLKLLYYVITDNLSKRFKQTANFDSGLEKQRTDYRKLHRERSGGQSQIVFGGFVKAFPKKWFEHDRLSEAEEEESQDTTSGLTDVCPR